jgi:hypothetical protein
MVNKTELILVIIGYLFLFSGSNLPAKSSTKDQGTIIFDFTGKKGDAPKAYVFGRKDVETVVTKLGMKIEEVINGSKSRQAFLKKLKKKYKRGTDNRWLSKEGDKLEVFVFFTKPKVMPGKKKEELKPKIEFTEKSRKTKISKDLSTLVKLIVAMTTKGVSSSDIELARTTYKLGKRRGTLTVSATLKEKKSSKIEVVTGPTEHWFLSTDLPVGKLSEVKFVQKTGTIEPRETPKNIYLGLNRMLGDILKEKQNILKNFFIKGMLKISKKPLDGYGMGIGYRFPKVRPLGIDISSFSVFGAVMWTKEENADKTETLTKRQVLFGIGYNLDKASGWMK